MIPTAALLHTVTVEPYQGQGGRGAVYGAAVAVRGYLEAKSDLVRTADGTETVASTTFYCDRGPVIPPESRVTLPDGSRTRVLALATFDDGGLTGLDHLEVSLA